MSANEDILIEVIAQQANALLMSIDALRSMRSASPGCEHPENKVVNIGTMGKTSRLCTLCQRELPSPDKEAAT